MEIDIDDLDQIAKFVINVETLDDCQQFVADGKCACWDGLGIAQYILHKIALMTYGSRCFHCEARRLYLFIFVCMRICVSARERTTWNTRDLLLTKQ